MQKPLSLLFIIIVVLCAGQNHSATAQQSPLIDKLWLEGKVHYGFVIPHHDYMEHMTSQHISMLELDLVQASNGDRLWEQNHHYPLKGISVLYSDLGGAVYLGKAIAVIPYIDFNLTRGKKVNLFFRFGAGLGYLTRKFDRKENYKNTAIGSHFNAAIQMMYEMRWKASPRLDINLGVGLTHFSNGAIKTPNLGINIGALNIGCAWKLNKRPVERKQWILTEELNRKIEYSVFGIFGFSELYAAGGPKYYAGILSATILKPIGRRNKRKIGLGIDVFFDQAVVESMTRLGNQPAHQLAVTRPGLTFTHKIDFSNLSLLMQIGAYVYTLYKKDGVIYDRLSLQYCFKEHYLIHLGLKTHLFTADMIEYGIGYRF